MHINLLEAMTGWTTRLRFIARFSNCPRMHDESVAEHTFYTAFFTMMICLSLKRRGVEVKMDDALAKALMHDVDECFSGDFIRSFKHSDPILKNEIDKACTTFTSQLTNELAIDPIIQMELFAYWSGSKKAIEGQVVAFADFLSVVSYIAQEVESGNSRMLEQVEELRHFFTSFLTLEYGFLKEYMDDVEIVISRLEGQREERRIRWDRRSKDTENQTVDRGEG